jgi:hypothetical protein
MRDLRQKTVTILLQPTHSEKQIERQSNAPFITGFSNRIKGLPQILNLA